MMMPANFSAVNAEVVYGGAVADYLPNAWTAANVKQFSTNIITLVSNSFTSMLLNATLGVMFGGNWGEDKIFGDEGSLKKNIFTTYKEDSNGNPVVDVDDMTFGNKVMRTLGMASVVYTLGTAPAKIGFNDAVSGITDAAGNLGV